jgi:hypothetical protein
MRAISVVSLLFLAFSVSWGDAAALSRAATLYSAGHGGVNSISCAAPGACAAGGYYNGGPPVGFPPFVVSERNGSWRHSIEVSGVAPETSLVSTLNDVGVESISCAAAGDCAVGGIDGYGQAFVAGEKNGRWRHAIEVPGLKTLEGGNGVTNADVISCAAAGDCAAGGYYSDRRSNRVHAFVVNETNGRWRKAIEVPGTATLNTGYDGRVDAVSCAAPGDCTAGVTYVNEPHDRALLVSETNGRWGKAITVPGLAALYGKGGGADVSSISCAAPGDCAAGGNYTNGRTSQAFVVSEQNGRWERAIEVPGTATLNAGGSARVDSVSCGASGDCAAGGYYTDHRNEQAFVVSEKNGRWRQAIEVPGTAALNIGGEAEADSISCADAGDCAVAGFYDPKHSQSHYQPFVVSETNGSWGTAIEAPGTATLAGGIGSVISISCATAGNCAVGGNVPDGGGANRAFVVSETNGSWANAIRVSNFPASCVVPNVVGKPIRAAKKSLNAAHCGLGKITNAYSTLQTGRVTAQRPKPGRVLSAGSKVALTVSRG